MLCWAVWWVLACGVIETELNNMLPLFFTLLRQIKRWSNTFLSYMSTVLHGCSITCTSLTNSSACVEHVDAVFFFFFYFFAWSKYALYHNCCLYVQTVSSRRVHSYSYEFLPSGRSHWQKARQDVAKRLFCCLYLSVAFISSLSHPSLPVLLLCTNPHSVSLK